MLLIGTIFLSIAKSSVPADPYSGVQAVTTPGPSGNWSLWPPPWLVFPILVLVRLWWVGIGVDPPHWVCAMLHNGVVQ